MGLDLSNKFINRVYVFTVTVLLIDWVNYKLCFVELEKWNFMKESESYEDPFH